MISMMCSFSLVAAFFPAGSRALVAVVLVEGVLSDFYVVSSFMFFPLRQLVVSETGCGAGNSCVSEYFGQAIRTRAKLRSRVSMPKSVFALVPSALM